VHSETLLSARGLRKADGATAALDSVGFDIARGEIVCLIGRNGAGKTTLPDLLAGLKQPTSGEMHLAGEIYRPADRAEALAAGVGIVTPTFIQQMLSIEGATGAAIVDISTGMALATGSHPGFDLNVAAAGNADVVRAKLRTMTDLGIDDNIEDIVLTLGTAYHLITVLNQSDTEGLFIYLVLDRSRSNLALARHKVNQIAKLVQV